MKRFVILLFPVICIAVVLVCLGSLHGGPANPPSASTGLAGEGTGMAGLVLRVALALGLIVVLIFGAVYTLRFFSRGTGGGIQSRFRVLDRCYLAPKRALYSVRMGERVVVVGVTDASITPVLELSVEEGGALYPDEPLKREPAGNFASLLRGVATRAVRLRT